VAVRERLEDALELVGLVFAEPGSAERGAALDHGKSGHGTKDIEKT
jgi:hypothetical protein